MKRSTAILSIVVTASFVSGCAGSIEAGDNKQANSPYISGSTTPVTNNAADKGTTETALPANNSSEIKNTGSAKTATFGR